MIEDIVTALFILLLCALLFLGVCFAVRVSDRIESSPLNYSMEHKRKKWTQEYRKRKHDMYKRCRKRGTNRRNSSYEGEELRRTNTTDEIWWNPMYKHLGTNIHHDNDNNNYR
jgi:hypothetical protein